MGLENRTNDEELSWKQILHEEIQHFIAALHPTLSDGTNMECQTKGTTKSHTKQQ